MIDRRVWACWAVCLAGFALGAAGMLGPTVHYIAYGLALVGLLASGWTPRSCPLSVLVPAGFLAAWLLVAAWFAPFGHLGRLDSIVYALPLLLVGMALGSKPKWRLAFFWGIGAGLLVSLPVALAQFSIGFDASVRPHRVDPDGVRHSYVAGWMSHHIRFGTSVALATVVLLAAAGRGGLVRLLGWPLAVSGASLVVLSGARGALLALAAGFWGAFGLRGSWRRVLLLCVSSLMLVAGGLWALYSLHPSRVEKMFRGEDVRLPMWRDTLSLISDHPITGVGPDGFESAYQAGIESEGFHGWCPSHAHNSFLGIAATAGLPGLIAVCWLLVSLALVAWRRRRDQPVAWNLMAGAMCVFVVGGLTEDYLGLTTMRNFAFLVLGFAAGWSLEGQSEPTTATQAESTLAI